MGVHVVRLWLSVYLMFYFSKNVSGPSLQSNTVEWVLAVIRTIIVKAEPLGVIHSDLCPFSADIISTVEFNYSGELLATGDKGGRVVIFQHEQEVRSNME